MDALRNGTVDEKFYAARKLAIIGEPAVAPLVSALNDKNARVRKIIALTLMEIRDRKAVNPLNELLRSEADHEVRKVAETAIWRIKEAFHP